MIDSPLSNPSVLTMSGNTNNGSNAGGSLSCVYPHANPGAGKDGQCGLSDDSETPISSPDEPAYKLSNLNVPSSPSSSFKRELMDTSANGSF